MCLLIFFDKEYIALNCIRFSEMRRDNISYKEYHINNNCNKIG